MKIQDVIKGILLCYIIFSLQIFSFCYILSRPVEYPSPLPLLFTLASLHVSYNNSDSLLLTKDGETTQHHTETEPTQGKRLGTTQSIIRLIQDIYNNRVSLDWYRMSTITQSIIRLIQDIYNNRVSLDWYRMSTITQSIIRLIQDVYNNTEYHQVDTRFL